MENPLALGQEHSCRNKQDTGPGPPRGQWPGEEVCPDPFVGAEPVWGPSQHRSQQNKGSRCQASHDPHSIGARGAGRAWGPHLTDRRRGPGGAGAVPQGGRPGREVLVPSPTPLQPPGPHWAVGHSGPVRGVGSRARDPPFRHAPLSPLAWSAPFPGLGGPRPRDRPGRWHLSHELTPRLCGALWARPGRKFWNLAEPSG